MIKKTLQVFIFLMLITVCTNGQLYFPPVSSNTWDTISPASLGWCQNKIDSLYQFLEEKNSRAFILLIDGKIVLEQYFNGHTAETYWYWASAGKTLTAFLTGIAQQENDLMITDTTSSYLGPGWTNCTPIQEEKITIRNQLTMTSGLDDNVPDPYCTLDTCLVFQADAGTRWAYHNAPYTLLDGVIEQATGFTLNQYITLKLKAGTGMDGLFIKSDYNNVFWSTPRSMARFGLLALNRGNWDGNQILADTTYFDEMVNTSQDMNKSYGYLWWLNGKESFMLPQSQFVFPGSINPNAPVDMFSAMGKNGQFLNVIPSLNMVWIRMGEEPGNSLVPFLLNDEIWQYINELDCHPFQQHEHDSDNHQISISPNPAQEILHVYFKSNMVQSRFYSFFNQFGEVVKHGDLIGDLNMIDIKDLSAGIYYLRIHADNIYRVFKVVKSDQ
jgi:CubicO group peptidase (beta-lactamase class C family)